jgi:hypothetical protein
VNDNSRVITDKQIDESEHELYGPAEEGVGTVEGTAGILKTRGALVLPKARHSQHPLLRNTDD